jgi:general L-amino acid transport system permease protein
MILIRGFGGVPPRLWGGFMLNITVAVVAITLSFPIGMLLALGRRSSLPVVRYFSIAVIELVRGNPLFILLTAGSFLLPLLLPPGMSSIPLIIRAMAIYVIFSSAYVAEIVRGGLQGLPYGQYEASRALGLSTTRMMALVILPQALRATIPAMISHFISVFKDTSLLAVIGGFTDVLKTGRRASAGLGQAGASLEALIPAALLFFMVAFSMSRWSQRLEKRLGVGER